MIRVTYRERATGGAYGAARKTRDIRTDVVLSALGGFLVFKDLAGAIILMVPEVSTDSVEQVEDEDA